MRSWPLNLMFKYFMLRNQIDRSYHELDEIIETIELLVGGDSQVEMYNNYRDMILLIGNQGTGKSTLTLFTGGNLADLIAIDGDDYDFLIESQSVDWISHESQGTIYPNFITDDKNFAFYDCPSLNGYEMSYEIAGKFYLKKVVDHSSSLKLVLVADYESVKDVDATDDFHELIQNVYLFMNHINSYKDAISLVVTKVEPGDTDKNVIDKIADFLKKYRNELSLKENGSFNEFGIFLVDILLTKNLNGKSYDKISLFRKPDSTGPLDKMKYMVEDRRKIRDMINRTKYVTKSDDDFAYTISSSSNSKLVALVDKLNKEIKGKLHKVGDVIESELQSEAKRFGNLKRMASRFESIHLRLAVICDDRYMDTLNADKIVVMMTNFAKEMKLSISLELFDTIQHLESYITFSQYFSTELKVEPREWMEGLKDCIAYLDRSKNWFTFLGAIYEKYSQHDFRINLTKYNVKDIKNWGIEGKLQGIHINQNNFWEFVKKQSVTLPVYENFPSVFELQVLNDLLQITFKDTIVSVCDEQKAKLVVKGHYVRVNEIDANKCSFDVKLLNIFASHTVFFDGNFTTNSMDIVVVAPNWFVVGNKEVALIGEDVTNAQDNDLDDDIPFRRSGTPGIAGDSSYNFVGFGKDFIDGEQLYVKSVGGKGGSGQPGRDGVDGQDPEVKLLYDNSIGQDMECYGNVKRYAQLKTFKQVKHWCEYYLMSDACSTEYYFRGECAKQAGPGGKGGKGGLNGDIAIFELGAESNITTILESGPDGRDGDDGRYGEKQSLKIKMSCYIDRFRGFSFDPSPYTNAAFGTTVWTQVESQLDEDCPPIDKRSKNTEGMILPTKLPFLDRTIHLSEYLSFMRESQIQRLKSDEIFNFVEVISNDESVLANYSLNVFVNELLLLEEQYHHLKDKIEIQRHYYLFASKIERFVEKWRPASREQMKLFTYLYAAAWGKYLALKSRPFLIIDIQSYLDSTIHTIGKVDKASREQIIDDYQKQYRDQIMSKIKDINALISSDIMPVIKNIKDELNNNMQSLVEETVAIQDQINHDIIEYEGQLMEINQQMGATMAFGVLDVVSTFASCLGPYGMAAGAVINVVSQVGSSFKNGVPDPRAAIEIPGGVKTALQQAKTAKNTRREKRLKLLNEQLDHIDKAISTNPDEFQDIIERFNEIREKLQTTNSNEKIPFKDIDAAEKSLTEIVEEKKIQMEKEPAKFGKKLKKIINKISNGMTVLEASMDVYEQFKDSEDQMNVIREALDQSKDSLNQMQEFERSIYDDIWPMLSDMLTEINEIEAAEATHSHVSIDLKKFKIHSCLRDIKFQMHQFVKGFEAEENLMQTFQKLDDVYLTLMSIYDRIEDYQDQAKLRDFIADIASSNVESIIIDDPNLRTALRRLDVIINSNILLNQYKSAVDGFKHTVFPFASYYLKYYNLPTNLQVDDFSMLVSHASNQLKDLKTKYTEYNEAIINENDEFIIEATFVNGLTTSEPFYEWLFEDHVNVITDLLSGKSVTIRADIRQGISLNAIKFNIIKLAFDNSNRGHQAQLQKKLLNFDVTLTHMGNSYYRCGTSYYMIHSPATVIMYSNQEANGVPLRHNNVYNKLLNGDILLSPYALWTMQLEYHAKGSSKTEFEKLKKLAKGTDLFLVGKGMYVRNDVPCSLEDDYKDFEIDL